MEHDTITRNKRVASDQIDGFNPDEALEEIRTILSRQNRDLPGLSRLAQLVSDLDGWLSADGYLPYPWREM